MKFLSEDLDKNIEEHKNDGLTVAQRIKLLRSLNSMNQQQFAEFIGVSQSMISALEIEARTPSQKLLRLIAEKNNCSFLWLSQGITYTDIIKKEQDSFRRDAKEHIITLLEKMNTESLYYLQKQAELIYSLEMEKTNADFVKTLTEQEKQENKE